MKQLKVSMLFIVAFSLVSGSLTAQTTQEQPEMHSPVNHVGEGHVDLEFCRVMFISEINVPAQESGPLLDMPVRLGQAIEPGQELARIDDRLAQLRLDTAQTKLAAASEKANNDVDVRAANNALDLAETERKRNYQLLIKRTMPQAEYDRSALQAKQAALQVEQAQRDMQTAVKEAQIESHNVRAATDSIDRHVIKSPQQGVVMERFKEPGEWVNAGDDVMRIARMDTLFVQGLLDSSLFNPHEVDGQNVTISVEVARGERLEFQGRIVFVSLEKQNARSYIVRAEVENRQQNGRWLLLANEEAIMRIHLGPQSVTQAPPPNFGAGPVYR
ncbi:MAG: efflux RND transporter periplasmic adaptor subunit [Pirellulaceae bacterium]